MPPIITLTTDFGLQDPFVGIMKGVILSICPSACLVDLTHDVEPQDILGAALALEAALPFFPDGTVHLAVVDPGVGSARRPLAVRIRGQYLVGPDNGVLTPALLGSQRTAVALTAPEYRLPQVSRTFHGRDVFAPAAAYLAAGIGPVAVEVAGQPVAGLVDAYADGGDGRPAAIVGSTGRVEIFVRCGSARQALGVGRGAPVRIRKRG